MNNIETTALELFMSSFPTEQGFEDTLSLILDGQGIVWEPFEDYSLEWVVEQIRTAHDHLALRGLPKEHP